MRIIYKIAKTELQMLFYSPIAWLLLLSFVIQTAINYTGLYELFVTEMASYGNSYHCSNNLFVRGIGNLLGIWNLVQGFLYFYIPLLTMGVVSKELSSGSVKLLYSSPVNTVQIILGKYLAMVMYALLLVAILLGYVLFAAFTIKDFELAWILGGLLGLFLLTCTYMAVGVFLSSLTTYQVIAAVGTFVVLMLLSMVSGWGQTYDVVREITYWLGIGGRTSTFIEGMICSEDLIYFPVVIMMFLALTIIRMNAVRQKEAFPVTLKKYAGVVVVVCLIAWVSSRPVFTKYYDLTSNQRNTLTPVSQKIVSGLNGGLTITSYVNILDPGYLFFKYPDFIMDNREQFRHYSRFKPEIKMKVVYYYADTPNDRLEQEYPGLSSWQKACKLCQMYDVDSMMLKTKEEVDEMVDLSDEGYTFVRQIVRENGQKEWLRRFYYGGGFPGEGEISVALKRMIMDLPKIGFVSGHRERELYGEGPLAYSFALVNKKHRFALCNQGFDVDEISLHNPVPDGVNLLVWADMRSPLTAEEEYHLKQYIEQGKNLFILGDPRHREVQNPFLQEYFGLKLTPVVVGYNTKFEGNLPANVLACRPTNEAMERMYHLRSTYSIAMEGCSGIEQTEDKGFQLHPFLRCDSLDDYWTELETTDFADDTVRWNPAAGEQKEAFMTVVGLTREVAGKEQRVLVAGDVDFLANQEFMTYRKIAASNYALLLGGAYWLSHEVAPLDMRRYSDTDNKVYLDMKGFGGLKWGLLGILPFLLVGIGAYIWIRRKGR